MDPSWLRSKQASSPPLSPTTYQRLKELGILRKQPIERGVRAGRLHKMWHNLRPASQTRQVPLCAAPAGPSPWLLAVSILASAGVSLLHFWLTSMGAGYLPPPPAGTLLGLAPVPAGPPAVDATQPAGTLLGLAPVPAGPPADDVTQPAGTLLGLAPVPAGPPLQRT